VTCYDTIQIFFTSKWFIRKHEQKHETWLPIPAPTKVQIVEPEKNIFMDRFKVNGPCVGLVFSNALRCNGSCSGVAISVMHGELAVGCITATTGRRPVASPSSQDSSWPRGWKGLWDTQIPFLPVICRASWRRRRNSKFGRVSYSVVIAPVSLGGFSPCLSTPDGAD